jgi:hypothetical protein
MSFCFCCGGNGEGAPVAAEEQFLVKQSWSAGGLRETGLRFGVPVSIS